MRHKHELYHHKTIRHPYLTGNKRMKVYACKKCNDLFVKIDNVRDTVLEVQD